MKHHWIALLIGLVVMQAGAVQAHAVRATEDAASAHGVAHGAARVLRFAYSTGEAAEYCAVEVYAPDNATVEFQNGRTDARGLFAFVPDKSGTWKVIMTDGMGHKLEHVLEVADSEQQVVQGAASGGTSETATAGAGRLQDTSMWLRAVLGVSLLLNMFAGLALWRRKKSA